MTLAALGQLCSTASLTHNAQIVSRLIVQASAARARVLFLPEASDYIAANAQESLALVQPVETSPFIAGIRATLNTLPEEARPLISVGVHEPSTDGRVKNTLLWLDGKGNVVHRYQKLHLFDVDIAQGPKLTESDSVQPGQEVPQPFASPLGTIGPGICYDIRFPEHALRQRTLGADILLFPSAFTVKTGLAHWETLARARAIDTQCFVVMAAQAGSHNPVRQSYGHSVAVDPWGTVIARAGDETEALVTFDVDLALLSRVRENMPLWQQRRTDLFGSC